MSKYRMENSRKRHRRAKARQVTVAKAGAAGVMFGTLTLVITCGAAMAATTGGTTTVSNSSDLTDFLLPPGDMALLDSPSATPSSTTNDGAVVLPPGDINDPSLAAQPAGESKSSASDLAVVPSVGSSTDPSDPQTVLLAIAGPAPVRPNDSDPASVISDVPSDPSDPPAAGESDDDAVVQGVLTVETPAAPEALPNKTALPPTPALPNSSIKLTAAQTEQLQKAADKASSLIGVAENPLGSNAGGLVNAITGGIPQQWCGLFGVYVWDQAGIAPFFTGATAAYGDSRPDDQLGRVLKLADNFPSIQGQLQDRGQYVTRENLKNPPPNGAFVIFSQGGVGHLAVVVGSTATHVTVVGGNERNRVQRDTYALTDPNILGYGVPFAAASATAPAVVASPVPVTSAPSTPPKEEPANLRPPTDPVPNPPVIDLSPPPVTQIDSTVPSGQTPGLPAVDPSTGTPPRNSVPAVQITATPGTGKSDSPGPSNSTTEAPPNPGISTDVLTPPTDSAASNSPAVDTTSPGSNSASNDGSDSSGDVIVPPATSSSTGSATPAVVGGVLSSDPPTDSLTSPQSSANHPPALSKTDPAPKANPPKANTPATLAPPAPVPAPASSSAAASPSLPPILAGYWQYIQPSSQANGVDPLLLAAVICREHSGTCTSNPNGDSALLNVNGDGGHGRGVGQIDDRSHGQWLSSHHDGLDPASNIDYAAQMLAGDIQYFKAKGLSDQDAMRYGVAAYNAGIGGAEAGLAHGNPDRLTAGQDYSSWVMNKFQQFKSN